MIHCVREAMPNFPPDPGRERTVIKGYVVEYSGPVPTEADLDAFLSPPRPKSDLDALRDALIRKGTISQSEIDDEKTRGR